MSWNQVCWGCLGEWFFCHEIMDSGEKKWEFDSI